jgi:release factor glutamine methyltransferase
MSATPTLRSIIQHLRERLTAAGIDEAAQETAWMVEAASGYDRLRQMTEADQPLPASVATTLETWLGERLTRKPLAQIIGWSGFYGLRLMVTPHVLCPRPETELLVDLVRDRLPTQAAPGLVADLGTGSGAIALALASVRPDLSIIGIDRSPEALAVARRNADNLGLKVDWRLGDWCAPLRETEKGHFQAIVSNPPYIPHADWEQLEPEVREHEPIGALVGGTDGLDPYRILPQQAWDFLAPGALLAVEHGQGQGEAIQALFRSAGYVEVGQIHDYAGIDRIVHGRKAGH